MKNGNISALKDHMLNYNRVSQLDALIIFGVQSFTSFIYFFRREGYVIHTEKVPMIKVLVRVNKYCKIEPPKNLPTKEVIVTDYWLGR